MHCFLGWNTVSSLKIHSSADIRFDEKAPSSPFVYKVANMIVAKEFNWKIMDMQTGVLKHINKSRALAGLKPIGSKQ